MTSFAGKVLVVAARQPDFAVLLEQGRLRRRGANASARIAKTDLAQVARAVAAWARERRPTSA